MGVNKAVQQYFAAVRPLVANEQDLIAPGDIPTPYVSAKVGFCDRQCITAKRPATIKMSVAMMIDMMRETTSPRTHHSRVRAGVTENQAATAKEQKAGRRTRKGTAGGKKLAEPISRPRIEERLYCTQRCLLGLAYGGAMDKQCPDF